MQTSTSFPLSWPLWACSESSQLFGRFFMSDRCFPNRFAKRFTSVTTIYKIVFLTAGWNFPICIDHLLSPWSSWSWWELLSSLCLYSVYKSDTLIWCLVVLGRRNAVVYGSVNILLNRSSDWRTGKCWFRMDGTRLSDGCRSETKTLFTSIFSYWWLISRSIWSIFLFLGVLLRSFKTFQKEIEKDLAMMVIL